MDDREKPNESLGSIVLCQRLEEDSISKLPDSLICQILSHLPTKDIVKTSVLSTRWKSLWLWVPCLELKSYKFPDFISFVSFGDMFFHSDRVSCIHKLELGIVQNEDGVCLKSWIDAAIKRKIQQLDVSYCVMPLSLYVCETLVSLKLCKVILDDAEFVSLPCLKTMHLGYNMYPNETTFERLVSGCPVLEVLRISTSRDAPIVLRVHSQSLKRLTLGGSIVGVVIDAPLLFSLSIDCKVSTSFIVNNLDVNGKLDISLFLGFGGIDEANRSIILSFLPWISSVRDLTIGADTFKLLCGYSKLEPLPQLVLSCLCVNLDAIDLKLFPNFLESCPNLKSLILKQNKFSNRLHPEEIKRVSFSFVPECLLSSLECVEFEGPILGFSVEMKLVRYFLENSAILKKLTLRLDPCSKNDEILERLLELPRGSTTCEVVIL